MLSITVKVRRCADPRSHAAILTYESLLACHMSATTTLLLNYQRNGKWVNFGIWTALLTFTCALGTPFYNLLALLPLRDATGSISYFIGGCVEKTIFQSFILTMSSAK